MFPKDGVNTLRLSRYFFDANRDGGSGGNDDSNSDGSSNDNNQNNNAPATFDAWLDAQPDEAKKQVKALYDASVATLQATIKATRQERDDFSRQLRETTKRLKDGDEAKEQLNKLADDYDKATKRADFMEEAISEQCRNAKAAYAIAVSDDLFTKSGAPDWKAIKAAAPELFGEQRNLPRKKVAGSGTNTSQEASANASMNDWIRRQARNGIVSEQT